MKNEYSVVRKNDIGVKIGEVAIDFVMSFETNEQRNVENVYSFGEETPFASVLKDESYTIKLECVHKVDLFENLSRFTLTVSNGRDETVYNDCTVVSKNVCVKSSDNNVTISAVIHACRKG